MILALTKIINAKNILEIGTYTGLSSLSFLHDLSNRNLVTVDIIEWYKFKNTVLIDSDFEKNNFKQVISDFSEFEEVKKYSKIIKNADLIFCDGPKDGYFEKKFLYNLKEIKLKNGCILIFDDIKQWNMIEIWYKLNMPKIDISSIGHFTGTGLVEWNNNNNLFYD